MRRAARFRIRTSKRATRGRTVVQIRWSETAANDLAAIHAYIARDSVHYATKVCADLVAAVDRLELFPEQGRVVPELPNAGLRELIVGSYRVVYRRRGEEAVEVVTVFHGARLLRLEGRPTEPGGA